MRLDLSSFNAVLEKVDAILQVERSYKSGRGAFLTLPSTCAPVCRGRAKMCKESKMCKDQNCRGGRELALNVITFFENSKSAA